MSPHPDLINPNLPDTDDLNVRTATTRTRPSVSLRNDDFEWPESGPSSIPMNADVEPDVKRKARVGPFGAKVVASMTGAMTTSLLMTPFDVLKTRLQTVQPRSSTPTTPAPRSLPIQMSSECCQTSILTTKSSPLPSPTNPLTCLTSTSTPTSSPALSLSSVPSSSAVLNLSSFKAPDGCAYPNKWAGIWGENLVIQSAATETGSGALVMPLRGVEEDVVGGFWNELATVRRETGVRGLWKGVGTTLTMSIPSAAIYMLGYEHLLSQISPHFTKSDDPVANVSALNRRRGDAGGGEARMTPAPLIAGSLARTFSASIISPIEMFRTRLQALPGAGKGAPTYATTSTELVNLVKDKGVTILWRGLGPTLWRDVPFSGIYWAGFELLKTSFSQSLPHLSPLTTSFLSGALSGTLAALLTQPFDVLKTRRQVFTPSQNCISGSRAATLPLAMHVYKTEGIGALFAGVGPRCGKVAPACGLMIACYEGVGRWLGGEGDD